MPDVPGVLNYPSALDTAVSLVQAANAASTTLTAQYTAGATTLTVADNSLFPTSGLLSIGTVGLILSYTGKSSTTGFTGVARASATLEPNNPADQTVTNGSVVEGRITAGQHGVLAGGLIAAETKLGAGSSTPLFSSPVGSLLVGLTPAGSSGWTALADLGWDSTNKYLGIGINPPGARLHVSQASGFTSRTNLFGDTTVSVLAAEASASGFAGGSTELAAAYGGVLFDPSANPGAASSVQGLILSAQIPATNATASLANLTVRGFYASAIHRGSGTLGALNGYQSAAINQAGGTVTYAYGAVGQVLNNGAGTITNAYGLWAGSPLNPSGTLGNTYGLFIDRQSQGTQTNQAYGIYQAWGGDRNYLTGPTTTPLYDNGGAVYNIRAFANIHADKRQASDAAYTAGNQVTSTNIGFSAADVGKYIVVLGGASATSTTGAVTTTSGANTLTLVGAAFTQLDVGKWLKVPGSGASGGILYTTIASVTGATTATMAANAGTTQSAVSQTVVRAGWATSTISSVAGTTATLASSVLTNTNLTAGGTVYVMSDDTPGIQAAIDSLGGAVTLFFPPGTYSLCTGPLVCNKQLSLRGNGILDTAFLLVGTGTFDAFQLQYFQGVGINGVQWSDFSVGSIGDRTGGAALRIGYVGQSSFLNIKVSQAYGGRPFDGIAIHRCSQSFFDRLNITGCAGDGIKIDPLQSPAVNVDLWFLDSIESEVNLGHGLVIYNGQANGATQNVQGIYIGAGAYFNNAGNGIRINPSNPITNIFLKGTVIDSNLSIGLNATGTGINHLMIRDCWFASNGLGTLLPPGASAQNIWLDSGVLSFVLDGNYILNAGLDGVMLWGPSQGRVQNNSIFSNSQNLGNTYYGIEVRSSASSIQIQGNRLYNNTPTHQNGLYLDNTVQDIEVFGNFLDTGSGTVPLNIDTASGQRVRFFGNQLDATQDAMYGLDQLVLGTSVPPTGTRYGLQLVGSGLKMGALATPTAPGVSSQTGTGNNFWYWLIAEDASGNRTLQSAATNINNTGNPPNATVTITPVSGGAKYWVLRTTSSTFPSGTNSISLNAGGYYPPLRVTNQAFTITDNVANASLSSFVSPTRNATADATIDGILTLGNGLVIAQGTLTASANALSNTATWNASGTTFTALLSNITDTASAGGSLLQDLQVGGASKWRVDKLGNEYAAGIAEHGHMFPRHIEVVTSAAATLQTVAGVARTITPAVATTNQKDARGEWLRISATANNADSSIAATTFTETQVQADPILITKVQIPTAIVNMRVFVGLFSAAAVMTTDTQNTISSAYFRFSTGASDTQWQCCTSNATSTTVTASGITVAINTVYVLKIDLTDAANVRFYINGALVATNTATLPAAATNLTPGHYLRSLSASGQKDLDTGYTYLWQS